MAVTSARRYARHRSNGAAALKLIVVVVAISAVAGTIGRRLVSDAAQHDPPASTAVQSGDTTLGEVAAAVGTVDASPVADAAPEHAKRSEPLVEVEGTGSIGRGSTDVRSPSALDVSEVAWSGELPAGVLAVGSGLRVRVLQADVQGQFDVRLALPAAPQADAVPGVILIADDGSMSIEAGRFDPATNSVVVHTSQFPDRFGAWWDSRYWVGQVVQVSEGMWGVVAR